MLHVPMGRRRFLRRGQGWAQTPLPTMALGVRVVSASSHLPDHLCLVSAWPHLPGIINMATSGGPHLHGHICLVSLVQSHLPATPASSHQHGHLSRAISAWSFLPGLIITATSFSHLCLATSAYHMYLISPLWSHQHLPGHLCLVHWHGDIC